MDFNPSDEDIERATRASRAIIQGSVISLGHVLWMADLEHPLTEEAHDSATGEVRNPIIHRVDDKVMVLTQTCDLYWTGRKKHLAVICPIALASPNTDGNQIKGAMPQFINIPWCPDAPEGKHWVADLRYITTIERSLLVGAEEIARPTQPAIQRELARNLGRYLYRAAIPNDIVTAIEPLQKKSKDNHRKQNAVGNILRHVRQLRLHAYPDYDGAAPHALTVIFVIDENLLDPAEVTDLTKTTIAKPRETTAGIEALDRELKMWDATGGMSPIPLEIWTAAASELVGEISVGGPIGSVIAKVATGLTPREYEDTDQLDVEYLSETIGRLAPEWGGDS